MKIGSMCSGYGGLDLAAEAHFDARTVWHCEIEPGPANVLRAHWPGVPNHGDLTTVDWSTVEPIDILTAGYPCQPFSLAGQRQGTEDARHIWPDIAHAISVLGPRIVVLENVRSHLSLGFDEVLGDLTDLGYDTEWVVVRASDIGAPHRRERLFVVACYPDRVARQTPWERGRRPRPGDRPGPVSGTIGPDRSDSPTDPDGSGWRRREEGDKSDVEREHGDASVRSESISISTRSARPASDADINGFEGDDEPESEWVDGEYDAPGSGAFAGFNWEGLDEARTLDLGKYEPAIKHWERLTRPAPQPLARRRLSPRFVEWMMGLPNGWVTDHAPSAATALHILGNGVVPQQAKRALEMLHG